MAVAAALQVDAHLLGGLHLELVHGLPGLGDVELIVIVAHNRSLLFGFPESQVAFRQESFFSFRNPILSQRKFRISGECREIYRKMANLKIWNKLVIKCTTIV